MKVASWLVAGVVVAWVAWPLLRIARQQRKISAFEMGILLGLALLFWPPALGLIGSYLRDICKSKGTLLVVKEMEEHHGERTIH